MQFADKSVLITGAAAGIGRATALAFAAQGARVAVADIADDGARDTAQQITQGGGRAISIQVDVTDAEQVQAMVRRTVDELGGLDIAFNNAGIEGSMFVRIADYDDDMYQRVMDVNTKGVWLCMKHEIKHFVEVGGGVIVNTASVAGLVGGLNGAPYFASKHAVVGLTRAVAMEYAKQNIRINAVCPAVIRTRMFEDVTAGRPDAEASIASRHPVGRIGTPEEVAAAVLFLSSDGASFMTGHAMPVDGGLVAC
ncbi:glucose 1-dehydrogenase [Haliangium sp.]|uniref:glucose 1-dehydrogenase n=1 Tax=Haliangium sp. TaxID=2663208 RepID=UPI003D0FD19C